MLAVMRSYSSRGVGWIGLSVLVVTGVACGGPAAEAPREPPRVTAPDLDELRALLAPLGAARFSTSAQERGCPADESVGDYVARLVKYGTAGDQPGDVHALAGGCVLWPLATALIPLDPPRDDAFWYCTIDSRTSDPAGESPWHYDLRVRVRRADRSVDLETAGCAGTP